MQTDRDALLAGILADPDADLPRLVFADWLEETGHPANCARAEYIRLAIELVRVHDEDTTRPERLREIEELKTMFDDELDVFHHRSVGIGAVRAERYRGFIDQVHVTVSHFAQVLAELSRYHPVTHIFVTKNGSPADNSVSALSLTSLRGLWLRDVRRGGPFLSSFLSSNHTPKLSHIRLLRCSLIDGQVVQLVRVLRECHQLIYLDLIGNPLTDHAAHTLAAAELAPTFRFLGIEGTRITNAGRAVLFRRFGFEELRPRLALS